VSKANKKSLHGHADLLGGARDVHEEVQTKRVSIANPGSAGRSLRASLGQDEQRSHNFFAE
jgi:hypothetical protein